MCLCFALCHKLSAHFTRCERGRKRREGGNEENGKSKKGKTRRGRNGVTMAKKTHESIRTMRHFFFAVADADAVLAVVILKGSFSLVPCTYVWVCASECKIVLCLHLWPMKWHCRLECVCACDVCDAKYFNCICREQRDGWHSHSPDEIEWELKMHFCSTCNPQVWMAESEELPLAVGQFWIAELSFFFAFLTVSWVERILVEADLLSVVPFHAAELESRCAIRNILSDYWTVAFDFFSHVLMAPIESNE